ncbi:MAG TPA: TrkA C-terminal domain-containing protein [Prolixibacteraceae bacterium]|nr:TrkA C-terminal domain-containing protein [Prolixibacteraceae bacterium]
MMELFTNTYFAFFLIVTLGFLLGRIKIKGVSLDVSAVIFIALVFGHFGVIIPNDFQQIGLVLFIFTIGLQAGPGFFSSFKKHGKNLAILASTLIVVAGITTIAVVHIFGIDKNIGIGLLTGALTSTPGLAAAIDVTKSPMASIGYGVAYPFGVIGVILFVSFLPKIMGKKIKQAEIEFESEVKSDFPEISKANFIVENENAFGKTIGELRIRFMTRAVVSRVMHEGVAITPKPDTILYKGDIIKAVGDSDALNGIRLLIGRETETDIPLTTQYDVRRVLVTNKQYVNKTIKDLNLLGNYGATITRITRSGINFSPSPNSRIQFADKLMIACSTENMKQVVSIFGDDDSRLSDTDFLPIALGIIIGVLIGRINISVGNFNFSPGLTGGVLIAGLLLGRTGKTGPVLWTMTSAANQLIRQLGLLFFMAAVGTAAGANLVETFIQNGYSMFIAGAIITIVPMVIATLVAKFFFKINILTLLGALTGSMTSTPGLAAVDNMTKTNAPSVAYATVYPLAMVLLIVVVQLVGLIL